MAFSDIPARTLYVRSGDPPYMMARVRNVTGPYLQQAQLAGGSITWTLYELRSAAPSYVGLGVPVALANGTLTVADVVFDALVTPSVDARWTEDLIGYNFSFLGPNSFTALSIRGPGKRRVEIMITPISGPYFYAGAWELVIAEMLSVA